MKAGLNCTMAVKIDCIRTDDVEQIEFIFKKLPDKKAKTVKKALYPGNVIIEDGKFLIPWTAAETYLFDSKEPFYMDTRVILKNSDDQPETNIIKLYMSPTLFEE